MPITLALTTLRLCSLTVRLVVSESNRTEFQFADLCWLGFYLLAIYQI